MTGSAFAADIYVPPPAPPVAPPAPLFSWAGSYAGAYGGVYFPFAWQAGVTLGHNFVRGSLIYGLEIQAGLVRNPMGSAFTVDLNARAGVAVGTTDRVLLYTEAGIGAIVSSGGPYVSFGAGAEIAVTDSLSLFAEAKALAGLPGPPGLIDAFQFQAGVNWHFGRD
ncbi:MAG: hypothetical protein KIS96_01805 [Bauldia sp.]|nr:hypothetical protein [Bauldia sp.]